MTLTLMPEEASDDQHNSARDWSKEKYGIPIGYDASEGCYKAMRQHAPKLKPLVWDYTQEFLMAQAEFSFGFYSIFVDEDSPSGRMYCQFHAKKDGDCMYGAITLNEDKYLELDDLQKLAQADYERRVRELFE